MNRILLATFLYASTPFLASAATIINYDFNNQSFGVLSNGSFWTMQSQGGIDNSPAARLEYSTSGTAGKNLSLNVSSLHSNEFFIEFDVRVEGNPSGGSKFVKLFGDAQPSKNNMTLGMNYYGNNLYEISYYGDTRCTMRFAGSPGCGASAVTSSSAIEITGGGWGHYKAWVKRASPGLADGAIKIWWNGELRLNGTDMDSNPASSADPTPGFSMIEFGGYNHSNFNGNTWYLWIDNLSVSTTDLTSQSLPTPINLTIKPN
jgi:hypothetical protein